LGNTNITIFAPEHKPLVNLDFVVRTLRESFGMSEARISERKDVFLAHQKISGSAYRIAGPQCYHHMTMLINTNLDLLRTTLLPTTAVATRATASYRSSVTNLFDHNPNFTHEKLCVALVDHFLRIFGNTSSVEMPIFSEVSVDELLQIPEVVANANELRVRI